MLSLCATCEATGTGWYATAGPDNAASSTRAVTIDAVCDAESQSQRSGSETDAASASIVSAITTPSVAATPSTPRKQSSSRNHQQETPGGISFNPREMSVDAESTEATPRRLKRLAAARGQMTTAEMFTQPWADRPRRTKKRLHFREESLALEREREGTLELSLGRWPDAPDPPGTKRCDTCVRVLPTSMQDVQWGAEELIRCPR